MATEMIGKEGMDMWGQERMGDGHDEPPLAA
jgi:hypothetical protein